jgi:hypothetical protein
MINMQGPSPGGALRLVRGLAPPTALLRAARVANTDAMKERASSGSVLPRL